LSSSTTTTTATPLNNGLNHQKKQREEWADEYDDEEEIHSTNDESHHSHSHSHRAANGISSKKHNSHFSKNKPSKFSAGAGAVDAAAPVSETVVDESVVQLKKLYSAQYKTLADMFSPEWSEGDLLATLEEVQGDLEVAINRIMEGVCSLLLSLSLSHSLSLTLSLLLYLSLSLTLSLSLLLSLSLSLSLSLALSSI
jgi:hypothetical protein